MGDAQARLERARARRQAPNITDRLNEEPMGCHLYPNSPTNLPDPPSPQPSPLCTVISLITYRQHLLAAITETRDRITILDQKLKRLFGDTLIWLDFDTESGLAQERRKCEAIMVEGKTKDVRAIDESIVQYIYPASTVLRC